MREKIGKCLAAELAGGRYSQAHISLGAHYRKTPESSRHSMREMNGALSTFERLAENTKHKSMHKEMGRQRRA